MAPSSGKKAIAVGNWFGDEWRPNARQSIAAIARRWGLEVIELTNVVGTGNGFGEKLWLDVHCAGFDRVIWFDRDILVRHDCPNLLELVTEGRFGCVASHQETWHTRESAKTLAQLFEQNGETYDFKIDHLNTGVMVFEPGRHAPIFEAARRFSETNEPYEFFDEPWLSLAVKKSGQRQFLNKTFNRCGVANLGEFTPVMFDYIWHFCGLKSEYVNAQIDATIWQGPVWRKPVVGTRPAKKIVGFWHIATTGDWQRGVAAQYAKLKESGLYDESQKIVVGFIGGEDREAELSAPIWADPKFDLFTTPSLEDNEFATLIHAWSEATQSSTPFLCYYIDIKGSSSGIERWEECAEALRDHDACGVEPSGGSDGDDSWWATSDYLKTLPDAQEFWSAQKNEPSAAKRYLLMGQPRLRAI